MSSPSRVNGGKCVGVSFCCYSWASLLLLNSSYWSGLLKYVCMQMNKTFTGKAANTEKTKQYII